MVNRSAIISDIAISINHAKKDMDKKSTTALRLLEFKFGGKMKLRNDSHKIVNCFA